MNKIFIHVSGGNIQHIEIPPEVELEVYIIDYDNNPAGEPELWSNNIDVGTR